PSRPPPRARRAGPPPPSAAPPAAGPPAAGASAGGPRSAGPARGGRRPCSSAGARTGPSTPGPPPAAALSASALPRHDDAGEQLLEEGGVGVAAARLLEVQQVGHLGLRELHLDGVLVPGRVQLVDGQERGPAVDLDGRLLAELVAAGGGRGGQLGGV